MAIRVTAILAAFTLILGLPYVLRPSEEAAPRDAVQLVVISPHNEAIRYEFGRAFRAWHKQHYGRPAVIDWRIIGGTSEIARYIDSEFSAAFKQYWTGTLSRSWNQEVARRFADYKVDRPGTDASDTLREARRAFLQSDVGIGIDVFFGGGWYEHHRMARKGYLVDCRLAERHPDWLADDVIPRLIGGEIYFDKQGRYYGACLSTFGICYNRDVLKRLGIAEPPRQWADLADPRYFRQIALADPTKSGSITKAFEMLIQQQMHEALAQRKAILEDFSEQAEREAVAAGFVRAMRLIQRIAANARYFSDGASGAVTDVADGNAAAAMCIDFYGRFEAEATKTPDGASRMGFVTPVGGSSVSADPIAMFRGAPHRKVAERFIEFVLSPEGQRLWNYRAGTPGGPKHYSLRRLPIRKDLYTAEHRKYMSDPDERPYELAAKMTYRADYTARLFRFIRLFVRAMVIDPHEELQAAWRAILAAGGPEAVPEAVEVLGKMPLTYQEALKLNLSKPLRRVRLTRQWAVQFARQYRLAARLAKAARR